MLLSASTSLLPETCPEKRVLTFPDFREYSILVGYPL
jgi:hypothetical protein